MNGRLVETEFLKARIDYNGQQLRSHFVREVSGIELDGIVAFVGSCYVSGSELVDLEDFEQGAFIKAKEMLHFIGEHFEVPLKEGNFRLRLFASIVRERLEELCNCNVVRDGDDIFVDSRKLSVAICTKSPTSTLFHFGINIDPEGAPVEAVGLEELGVSPETFARRVLDSYAKECVDVELAVRKVRGVD